MHVTRDRTMTCKAKHKNAKQTNQTRIAKIWKEMKQERKRKTRAPGKHVEWNILTHFFLGSQLSFFALVRFENIIYTQTHRDTQTNKQTNEHTLRHSRANSQTEEIRIENARRASERARLKKIYVVDVSNRFIETSYELIPNTHSFVFQRARAFYRTLFKYLFSPFFTLWFVLFWMMLVLGSNVVCTDLLVVWLIRGGGVCVFPFQ